LAVLVVAATVVVVACGGDDDDGSSVATTGAPVESSVVSSGDTVGTVGSGTEATTVATEPAAGATTVATEPSVSESTVPGAEPVSGGSLTLLSQTEAAGVDPALFRTSITGTRGDGAVGFALYGGLVLENPVTGEVDMSMAESVTSSDGLVWTLKLREGLVFSNGSPLDAEAVKLNWERYGAPDSTSGAAAPARAMSSIEVVDPLTVKITLAKPNGQWLRTLALYPLNFIAAPESWLNGNPDQEPIGAGPFTLVEWVRDDHMTLKRNPTYFDAPRPYVDELVIRPIVDGRQRYNALQTGQGQLSYNSIDFQIFAEAEEAGFGLYQSPLSGGGIFLFNTARAPFDDVRVRRAIQLGLDRNALNDLVQRGLADVAATIAAEGTPFYEPSIALPEPDPAEAQRLIDEVVAEQGGPITFMITTNPQTQATTEGVLTLLSQYDGLEISIQSVASPATEVVPGNFDMSVWGVFFIDPEPRFYDLMHSASGGNWGKYSNPEVDAALDVARVSQDPAERAEAYAIVQQILVDEAPFIMPWRFPSMYMFDEVVQQVETFGDGVPLLDQIWLSE
jgi:peptide/nickel transport system substrate-binding protein